MALSGLSASRRLTDAVPPALTRGAPYAPARPSPPAGPESCETKIFVTVDVGPTPAGVRGAAVRTGAVVVITAKSAGRKVFGLATAGVRLA
jgi:hypothetical protein